LFESFVGTVIKVKKIKLLLLTCLSVIVLSSTVIAAIAFSDVQSGAWYYKDVMLLSEQGIIKGYPDGTFLPNARMTCAEFVKLLTNSLKNYDPNTKMLLSAAELKEAGGSAEHWASPDVAFAVKNGIVVREDITNGSFVYDKPITRSYMAKLVVRALGLDLSSVHPKIIFSDTDSPYANMLAQEYIVLGYANEDSCEFRGYVFMTRAEAAAMIVRVREYITSKEVYRNKAILENSLKNKLYTEDQLIDFFIAVNKDKIVRRTFVTDIPFENFETIYTQASEKGKDVFNAFNHSFKAVENNKYELVLQF